MTAVPTDRRPGTPWGVMLMSLLLATSASGDSDHAHDAESTSPAQHVQTECPVMIGNPIDPNLFTVYRDKKVFFCCEFCKTEFEKNPAKYVHRLPQFASVDANGQAEHEYADAGREDTQLSLAQLIEPMGVVTLSLVAATVALGVFRLRWKPRLMLKMHKTCGVCALVSGAVHAALVVFLH